MDIRKIIVRTALTLMLALVAFILILTTTMYFLNQTNGTISSSGEPREYLLYIPASYDGGAPASLVISLHGTAQWAAAQQATSQWNRVADKYGFIVVYPSGPGFPNHWSESPGDGLQRDVQFISDLIDVLTTNYNIDAARVYVNGLSIGGSMSFALSCALPDKIAAVGTVAAAHTFQWAWCSDAPPMPVIAFHGTADPLVPYDGGPSGDPIKPRDFPGARSWMENWAYRNQCSPDPVESAVVADVTRLEYKGCLKDAAVVLYTVEGGGHSWPGGKPLPQWLVGSTSSQIDASDQMWKFFRQHHLDFEQTL